MQHRIWNFLRARDTSNAEIHKNSLSSVEKHSNIEDVLLQSKEESKVRTAKKMIRGFSAQKFGSKRTTYVFVSARALVVLVDFVLENDDTLPEGP